MGTPNTTTVVTADLAGLAYVSEGAAYGVEPASPAYQNMRFLRHSLKESSEYERSKEMRGDRQVIDTKRVGLTAGGTVDVELSANSHDNFMLAAIGASDCDFPANPSAVTMPGPGIQVAADGTITGTNVALGLDVGMFVKIGGLNAASNRTYRIIANASDNSFQVSPAPAGGAETDVTTATVQPYAFMENGIETWSWSLLEDRGAQAASTADRYSLGLGQIIGQWSMDAKVKSIITMAFEFSGRTFRSIADIAAGATRVPALETDVMGSVDEITGFLYGVDGAAADIPIESFTFSISNNLRERLILGALGPDSIGQGKFSASGSINAYFANKTILSQFENATDRIRAAFHVEDTAGNEYIFDFPRVKLTDGSASNEGENTDIMTNVTFDSLMDTDIDKTMRIHKLAAV